MGKKAEIAALRKQVEALQAEVAALRAVPWWQQQGGGVAYGWPQPAAQCTCGTSARCMKHFPADWVTIWVTPQNVCAGAAPVPQILTFNNAGCATPTMFEIPVTTFGAAGCAPQGQTFMVPAGR